MGLIVFVLLQSSIFTKEYQSGTLILALTKGLKRSNVVFAKTITLIILWSAYYWMCFGITYGYNAYFWDNSVAKHLMFSAVCWWLFGLWVLALMVLFSAMATSNSNVLVGTAGVVAVAYFVGLLPKVEKYMPTRLMDGNSLIYGLEEPKVYMVALMLGMVTGVLCIVLSVPLLNKKRI